MSEMLDSTTETSDAALISAVRAGDTAAYGELFGRHRDAANRLARQLVRGPDVDDLVAESFVRVLAVLQDGRGPDEAFRAYLLTAIRRLHIDRIRAGSKVRSTDDEAELDRAVEFVDPAEMRFEQGAAASAFASLPERWQLVLWHLDVEGQKPADIAPLLGMSANSVSALAYRAREGLRQAYLQGHLAPTLHESCRRTTGMLGSHVRKGLSARDASKVEAHLDDCSRCTGLFLELREVNSDLSGVLGPALLGPAFTGYAAATGIASLTAGAATVVGAKVIAGGALKLAIAPAKVVGAAVAGAGTQGVVAAAVVTSVATAGTVAVTTDFGRTTDDVPAASAPRTPGAAPTTDTAPSPTPTPESSAEPSATATEAEPTPSPTPTPTPDSTPAPEPTPTPESSTSEPTPDSATSEGMGPRTQPVPTPTEDPVTPTDFGLGAGSITNDDSLAQRRFSVQITATNPGRAADQPLTATVRFGGQVQYRGVVSAGWDCGTAVRDQLLTTLTCTTTVPAGQGTSFVVKARGIRPGGTITLTSPGDPNPDNDSAAFQSGPYLLLL